WRAWSSPAASRGSPIGSRRTPLRPAPRRAPPARLAAASSALEALTVDRGDGQRPGIHVGETAHVDRHHGLAVPGLAAPERLDAAGFAEQVADHHLVELVLGELIFTGDQVELLGRDEVEEEAFAEAMGAVALHDAREVGGDLIADVAAVTASGVFLRVGHD